MHLQPCDWLARLAGLGGRASAVQASPGIVETQVSTPLGQGVMAHNLPAWHCAHPYKPGLIKILDSYHEITHPSLRVLAEHPEP